MVQISTPWGDPEPGNWPRVRRFLSNYFDLLFFLNEFSNYGPDFSANISIFCFARTLMKLIKFDPN